MAWFALSRLRCIPFRECPIKFSEVSIDRATVLVPSKPTSFTVRMNEDTGVFVVKEGDTVVVSGRMELGDAGLDNVVRTEQNDLEEFEPGVTTLSSIDIYKELRVRGYDYDPFFQGMYSAKSDGSAATIVWRDALPKNVRDTMSVSTEDELDMMWLRSWVMFVDSVIQLTLLDEENTGRALFVPTKLESLECAPSSFLEELLGAPEISDPLTMSQSKLVPCTYNRHDGVVQARGLILKGLKTTLLKRNAQLVHRKKLEFVPFDEINAMGNGRQREAMEMYFAECERVARKVTQLLRGQQKNVPSAFDLNEVGGQHHSLLRQLQDHISNDEFSAALALYHKHLSGQFDWAILSHDRHFKSFFDFVTYKSAHLPSPHPANPSKANSHSSPNFDLEDRRHSLLKALTDFLNSDKSVSPLDLDSDLLLGGYEDELYYDDRLLKPFFDLVTYNSIYSPKHTSLDILEVTAGSGFNLCKKFTDLMEESLFSDQTTINYSLLVTGNESTGEAIPVGVQKIVNWDPLNEAMIPNSHLIICRAFDERFIQDLPLLNALYSSTKEGGFLMLITRDQLGSHDINLAIESLGQSSMVSKSFAIKGVVVQACKDIGYKLIGSKSLLHGIVPLNVALFRKQRRSFKVEDQVTIQIGLNNYDQWLEQLKTVLKEEGATEGQRVWLMPKLDEPLAKKRISGNLQDSQLINYS